MVTVNIKNSSSVKPSESTPKAKLWLSECDQIKAYTHATAIYIYPPDQVQNSSISFPFETLKDSLSRLLVSYYPLAGRLNWIGGGRFELDCNEMGVELIEAESEDQIEDLGDFCPSLETKKLVPRVDYTKDITELPLILVQLTKFKCGGISIGTAFSHIAVDGKGALEFISSWASFARGENGLTVVPYHDRTVFYNGDPLAKPRFDHVELKASPALIGQGDAMEERMKETATTMLKLPKAQVDKLKKQANEGRAAGDTSREYSRFEAMAAHVWRCVSKARRLRNEQLTSMRIAADCRNRIKPAIPSGYYGNAIMVTTSAAEVGELLLSLGQACGHITKALEKLNDDYIKSAIDFLASQEDLTPFRTGFHSSNVNKGLFLGNPNFAITSWFGLPIYEADFGWGKPIFMGPGDLGFEGRSFIIPQRDEEGSFVIPIRLQVAYLDDYRKCFYEDI